jgi:Domain of unknown function (DUF1707)
LPVTDPASLRADDAEREALAQELREHMLAGRLTSSEFEERVELAYKAQTRGELDALRADLPLSHATLSAELVRRKTQLRRRLAQEASGGLSASAVCVAIWLAAGASGSFWPIWVIVFTLLPAARDFARLFGPAPDLDSLEHKLNERRTRELARERRRARRERRLTR